MNLATLPFFRHVKWRPDAGELRRFAIAMLIGFSVLALLSAWRSGEIGASSLVLFCIGLSLAVLALVPRVGRIAYLAVYLPTSIIGYVVSNILLALMFFLVVTPLAFLLKLMGKDVLRQKRKQNESRWIPVTTARSVKSYYRQF